MTKIVIFGNSGSGKSTLAKKLSAADNVAHLDLDTIAWKAVTPPARMLISESRDKINCFLKSHDYWVIEGCYADLLQLVIGEADNIIFLNLSVEQCTDNAKSRPWEPHKYISKAAQDKNLDMLIDWISQYEVRKDHFSQFEHLRLFNQFLGKKEMRLINE